jgi:hypothetical protein
MSPLSRSQKSIAEMLKAAGRKVTVLDETRDPRVVEDERLRAAQAASAASPQKEALCIDCKQRPAVRAAGKSGKGGTDFCDPCWREEWTEDSDA